ncbi:RNA-directed DNA polymerase [Rhodovarius sp.]|uniref:RNA-directed DNA polymerase n=1 Tax=Rhodovarius sp. TaxID=2972673 RepID=UPI003340B5BB
MSLFSLENVFRQYMACRRNKRNTANALRFEARQELNLLALRDALADRSYEPARSVCFFVRRPKLREVFAADFRDRVVHHVLVSHLEKSWEPVFIHDSYACRKGKGVHVAVDRLQQFMREATANGTRPAFTLQLDIRNYFMSIDKQRLYDMVAARLRPHNPIDAEALWLTHKLVFHDCTVAAVLKGDPALVDRLPPHKTLFRAPPGKGLPIGNLNSQFFANVYLNALDQFVKHELKCRWYLRYCDDFVLVAESAAQLAGWKIRIEDFLAEHLLLQLNPTRERLRPVSDGVDFLGYIVRPFHLLVRRRVVGHLREALARSERALVRSHPLATEYRFDAQALDALQASLASYLGHLRKASCRRLLAAVCAANAWLAAFVSLDPQTLKLRRRDKPPLAARTLQAQYRHWQLEFASDVVLIQVGAFVERLQWPPRRIGKAAGSAKPKLSGSLRRMRPTPRGALQGFPLGQLDRRVAAVVAAGRAVTFVAQRGESGGGLMRRVPVARWVSCTDRLPRLRLGRVVG